VSLLQVQLARDCRRLQLRARKVSRTETGWRTTGVCCDAFIEYRTASRWKHATSSACGPHERERLGEAPFNSFDQKVGIGVGIVRHHSLDAPPEPWTRR